jgi:hypothetical protein
LSAKITPDQTTRLTALQANQVQVAVNAGLAIILIIDTNLRRLRRLSLNFSYLGINRAPGPLGSTLGLVTGMGSRGGLINGHMASITLSQFSGANVSRPFKLGVIRPGCLKLEFILYWVAKTLEVSQSASEVYPARTIHVHSTHPTVSRQGREDHPLRRLTQ